MNIMSFALAYGAVFWATAWLELPGVRTTRDRRLHSSHHHTSEKIYQCHSMTIDIDCCDDRGSDLKVGGRSFCRNHDKSKLV